MLDYHPQPQPDICDVCAYAVRYDLDCAYEHARTRVATAFLLQDLQDTRPARLSALAVSATGIEPGPVHQLDPRHWFWAMFYEPDIQLTLREQSR